MSDDSNISDCSSIDRSIYLSQLEATKKLFGIWLSRVLQGRLVFWVFFFFVQLGLRIHANLASGLSGFQRKLDLSSPLKMWYKLYFFKF